MSIEPDDYDDDEDMLHPCPMCDEENQPIGTLGSRMQYNCRACGMWYGNEADDKGTENDQGTSAASGRD